jgi:hypothetical protein
MSVVKFKINNQNSSYGIKIVFDQLNQLAEEISFSRREILTLANVLQDIELNIADFLDKNWQLEKEDPNHLNEFNNLYRNLVVKLLDFANSHNINNISENSLNSILTKKIFDNLSKIEDYISGNCTFITKTPAERIEFITSEYDELLSKITPLLDKKIMNFACEEEIISLNRETKKIFSTTRMQKELLTEELKENIRNNLQELVGII